MRNMDCLKMTCVFLAAAISGSAQSSAQDGREPDAGHGEKLFMEEFPGVGGNGRTCATCHVPDEAFGLTPQNVEARYQALQEARRENPKADDSLFRPIDANDGAEDFTNLRQHALVRVVIPLPTDATGQKLVWPVDDPGATEVALWRSVPTVLNTAFTAPYQLDGRQPTLQDQALGALIGHAEITREPNPRFLDDIAAFQETLFSSRAVKRLAHALAKGLPPPPTDPPLNALEQEGKALFVRHCAGCHGGPTQTEPLPILPRGVRNIHVSKPVPPFMADLPFAPSPVEPRLWAFRVPGQDEPVVFPSTDPGQALLTGNPDDLNNFDMPPLYGISKTAPYFHDNSAATLEEVMRHYQLEFIGVRRVIPEDQPRPDLLLDEEIPKIIAYLKKI